MEDESDFSCSICKSDYDLTTAALPCGHLYHKNCFCSWFKVRRDCPLCRTNVPHVNESPILLKLHFTKLDPISHPNDNTSLSRLLSSRQSFLSQLQNQQKTLETKLNQFKQTNQTLKDDIKLVEKQCELKNEQLLHKEQKKVTYFQSVVNDLKEQVEVEHKRNEHLLNTQREEQERRKILQQTLKEQELNCKHFLQKLTKLKKQTTSPINTSSKKSSLSNTTSTSLKRSLSSTSLSLTPESYSSSSSFSSIPSIPPKMHIKKKPKPNLKNELIILD